MLTPSFIFFYKTTIKLPGFWNWTAFRDPVIRRRKAIRELMEFFTHSHNAPPYQLICTKFLAVDNATDTITDKVCF